MPYNTVIVFTAFNILPAASLNTNFSNLDFLKTQVDTLICNGRLTLETGVAVSTADQAGKTTLYFTPFNGNKIGLYDGTAATWDLYTFTEKSLSLSGLIKGVVYDIYGYLSAGVLALESLAWKKVTASNSPTAGANKVINISDTAGLAVGMEVTVKDGLNSEIANITVVVASTSITVDNLGNGYTTPDVYGFNTRATALTLNNGIWVKSGDTTRRYLGTIKIIQGATGQCDDTNYRRFVWNAYNRVNRYLFCADTTNTWTYTTAAWRAANANLNYAAGRVGLVIGLADELAEAYASALATNSGAGGFGSCGVGVNSTTVNSAEIFGGVIPAASAALRLDAVYKGNPTIGFTYLQRLEISDAVSTTTWYGDGGSAHLQTGMLVKIKM